MDKKINNLSRRNFVKQSSIATGGLFLGPSILSSAPLFRKKEKKLRLAVVGCGGRGTGAVSQALMADENVKLVAMADAFQNRLDSSFENLSKMFDKERIKVKSSNKFVGFGSYKKAIDEADVVILTTPPGFRPQHFEYAIAQGKHVFMEKPVAVDVPGVHQVLETAKIAKTKNLKIGVGLQRHHDPHYIETVKRIQDGAIGDILMMRTYWLQGAAQVRTRAGLTAKYGNLTEMEYQMRNWYYFAWLGGDHIVEQHIHNIDICNWVMDDYPNACSALSGRQVRTGKDYGHIYDHHSVEFAYGKKWDIGTRMLSKSRQIQGASNEISENIHGTKGFCSVSGFRIKNYKGKTIWKVKKQRGINAYQIEHDDLFNAIRKNLPYNEAEIGAKSTLTGIMGRIASYTGAKITLKKANRSTHCLAPQQYAWDAAPPILPNADGYYPVAMPGTTKMK